MHEKLRFKFRSLKKSFYKMGPPIFFVRNVYGCCYHEDWFHYRAVCRREIDGKEHLNPYNIPFVYWTSKGTKFENQILNIFIIWTCGKMSKTRSFKTVSRYKNISNNINGFFAIDNKKEVVDMMELMNSNLKRGMEVSTYYFSMVCTRAFHMNLNKGESILYRENW